jgi:hypothetical protein
MDLASLQISIKEAGAAKALTNLEKLENRAKSLELAVESLNKKFGIGNNIALSISNIGEAANISAIAVKTLKDTLNSIGVNKLSELARSTEQLTSANQKASVTYRKLAEDKAKVELANNKISISNKAVEKSEEQLKLATERLSTQTAKKNNELGKATKITADGEAATARAAKATLSLSDAQSRSERNLRKHNQTWTEHIATVAGGILLYQGIRKAMSLAWEGIAGGVQAVSDYQDAVIGMASMYTTLAKDQSNIPGKYAEAKRYAEALIPVLQDIDKYTAMNLSQLIEMNTAFASQGIAMNANNKEQVQGYTNIANAILFLTKGQATSRQIAQEIKAAVEGQHRPSDALGKLLYTQLGSTLKPTLQTWREIGKAQGDSGYIIGKMGELLSGYTAGSQDMLATWSATTSSLKTTFDIVARESLTPVLKDWVRYIGQFNEYIREHKKEIASAVQGVWSDMKTIFLTIKENIWLVKTAFELAFSAKIIQAIIATEEALAALKITGAAVGMVMGTDLVIATGGLALSLVGIAYIIDSLIKKWETFTNALDLAKLAMSGKITLGEWAMSGPQEAQTLLDREKIKQQTGFYEKNPSSLTGQQNRRHVGGKSVASSNALNFGSSASDGKVSVTYGSEYYTVRGENKIKHYFDPKTRVWKEELYKPGTAKADDPKLGFQLGTAPPAADKSAVSAAKKLESERKTLEDQLIRIIGREDDYTKSLTQYNLAMEKVERANVIGAGSAKLRADAESSAVASLGDSLNKGYDKITKEMDNKSSVFSKFGQAIDDINQRSVDSTNALKSFEGEVNSSKRSQSEKAKLIATAEKSVADSRIHAEAATMATVNALNKELAAKGIYIKATKETVKQVTEAANSAYDLGETLKHALGESTDLSSDSIKYLSEVFMLLQTRSKLASEGLSTLVNTLSLVGTALKGIGSIAGGRIGGGISTIGSGINLLGNQIDTSGLEGDALRTANTKNSINSISGYTAIASGVGQMIGGKVGGTITNVATGAAAGAAFGPIGAVVGGVVGLVSSLFGGGATKEDGAIAAGDSLASWNKISEMAASGGTTAKAMLAKFGGNINYAATSSHESDFYGMGFDNLLGGTKDFGMFYTKENNYNQDVLSYLEGLTKAEATIKSMTSSGVSQKLEEINASYDRIISTYGQLSGLETARMNELVNAVIGLTSDSVTSMIAESIKSSSTGTAGDAFIAKWNETIATAIQNMAISSLVSSVMSSYLEPTLASITTRLMAGNLSSADMAGLMSQATAAGNSIVPMINALSEALNSSGAMAQQAASSLDSLKNSAWQLLNDVSSIRDAALKSMNSTDAALQKIMWNFQDAQTSVNNGFDALKRSVENDKTSLTSLNSMLESALTSVTSNNGVTPDQRASAQNALSSMLIAAQGGVMPDSGSLGAVLGKLTAQSSQNYSSKEAYLYDMYSSQSGISSLNDIVKSQITTLDNILAAAQKQIDTINGVDTSVISVESAVTALRGDFMTYFSSQLALANGSTASNDWYTQYYERRRAVLGYASGGVHTGGYRMVGEYGPELEYTGASRIFSNKDSRAIFDINPAVDQMAMMREDLRRSNYEIVFNLKKIVKIIDRWDKEGQPATRDN